MRVHVRGSLSVVTGGGRRLGGRLSAAPGRESFAVRLTHGRPGTLLRSEGPLLRRVVTANATCAARGCFTGHLTLTSQDPGDRYQPDQQNGVAKWLPETSSLVLLSHEYGMEKLFVH
jgi:hypothetical protein